MTTPTVERLWPGSTIALLATGPSLTAEDCERVRESGARVVAINDAFRLAPFADALYSSDRIWWPHYRGVPSFKGLKFGIGSAPRKANPFHAYSEITVLRNEGYRGLSTDPSGLYSGQNSGYAVINLAVHLGAARILLLGYDMARRNGKAHFFGDHPSGLAQHEYMYPSFRKNFDSLVDPLLALGVEVINCTPGSSLVAFPNRPLADVLTEQLAVAS